jgi:peptidoglycan/LPS O-acetylase OafA/YrhL
MEQQSNFIRNVTLGYGVFLIAWGIVISIVSESESITSYFPSILGAPLAVSGLMVMKKPEDRKLWMHIAATFGLLCALGGTRFFMVMGDGITYASGSQLMLLITGTAYTVLCVRSFIAARKAREAAEASA